MKESKLTKLVQPVREMIYQYDLIIKGYRERNSIKTAALLCDTMPLEIAASFGIIPLRLPSQFCVQGQFNSDSINEAGIDSVYDIIIVPEKYDHLKEIEIKSKQCVKFFNPPGYGEQASILLHESIDNMLKETGLPGIRGLDVNSLKKITKEYNDLRRLVRGICDLRKTKPDLLSNEDLFCLIEAALIFPPSVVTDFFVSIYSAMSEIRSEYSHSMPFTMVYAGILHDGKILDDVESAGCIVAEDDTVNGRRSFDLSVNPESDYVYYELLDAYSYNPLSSPLRSREERFELLYKLLRNYGIEFITFIEDLCSDSQKNEIDYLRVKLMRLGIDPLSTDSNNICYMVENYLKKSVVQLKDPA